MTEEEWLKDTHPLGMLLFILAKVSERRNLLFNCACCRRVWTRLGAEDQEAVIQAEMGADDADAIQQLKSRLEPERMAGLAMVGLLDHPVSEELASLLRSQTTLRTGLDRCGKYPGRCAYDAAKLSAALEPEHSREAAEALEEKAQAELVREIFGNPFRSVQLQESWLRWNDGAVPRIAQGIYEERAFDRLPILHDALLDAGCDNDDILAHCRGAGPHVRRCWVIDLLLGKA